MILDVIPRINDLLTFQVFYLVFMEWHSMLYLINYQKNLKPEELLYNNNFENDRATILKGDQIIFRRSEKKNKRMYIKVIVVNLVIRTIIQVLVYVYKRHAILDCVFEILRIFDATFIMIVGTCLYCYL